MVFTNANKHSYQLQNDSAAAGIGRPSSTAPEGRSARSTAHPPPSFPPLILSLSPSPSPVHLSTVPPTLANRLHLSSPLLSLPVSTRRRRTFDHPHSRVISRTIVPSPGLRKYLTLESRERKGRGRSRLSGWRAAAYYPVSRRVRRRFFGWTKLVPVLPYPWFSNVAFRRIRRAFDLSLCNSRTSMRDEQNVGVVGVFTWLDFSFVWSNVHWNIRSNKFCIFAVTKNCLKLIYNEEEQSIFRKSPNVTGGWSSVWQSLTRSRV